MAEKDIELDEELKKEEKETIAGETETEETASEVEENTEETEEEKDGQKKLFGKKKDKADKKSEILQAKVDELEDKVKRQLAEFENFRNRTEKEKSAMFETGAKSVVEKILPVVDNFERGLASLSEEDRSKPFEEGMEKTYKQLMTELEKMEVIPIEALGKEFDPEFHNAVMQVESDEYETGVVAQELLKGYTYRGQVVRHSMVAVVQ